MSSRVGESAHQYRRPWYWLVVVALLALAAAGVVFENMRSRVNSNDEQFVAAEKVRLQQSEQNIDYFFNDADQLGLVGAQTTAGHLGNLPLTEWLISELFRARKTADIYGCGVFYAPYAFDTRAQFVSIYVRTGKVGPGDTKLPDGIVQVPFYGPARSKLDDYTKSHWYRRAAETPRETRWDGPYIEEGLSYISTVHAIEHNGRLAGVFTVDVLTPRFKMVLSRGLEQTDIAWVESSVGGRWLLGTARLPANTTSTRVTVKMPLRYTGATLALSADATSVRYANEQIEAASLVLVVLIAALAFVAGVVLVQRWQAAEETIGLQGEQARLEREVSVARRVESELRRMAYTDALTGLPNRAAFMDWVRDLLETAPSGSHAVFLVDLDRFNIVNETIGHISGDELLRALASRLWSGMTQETSVARLGGDEFVIVAPVHGDADATAATVLSLIAEPIIVAGQTFKMQASLGIVAIEDTYASPEELLRDADIAVYHAKAQGRARWEFFDTTMRARVAHESELEADLRRAIERSEFVAHYQPLMKIATGAVASFEALIRWDRPGKGMMSAAEFIPFAEARGLIAPIDAFMLRTVCSQSAAIAALFPGAAIAVNISAAELTSAELPELVEALLADYKVTPDQLKLEITETAMMTRADVARTTLDRLRALGVAIVLDDFGTGYSSLAYLQRLPIVGLKIDRSFVENLDRDERALEIVRSIVAVAGSFKLETTAEGVENEAQLQILAKLGVTYAQGFLFSKAVDIAALGALRTTSKKAMP